MKGLSCSSWRHCDTGYWLVLMPSGRECPNRNMRPFSSGAGGKRGKNPAPSVTSLEMLNILKGSAGVTSAQECRVRKTFGMTLWRDLQDAFCISQSESMGPSWGPPPFTPITLCLLQLFFSHAVKSMQMGPCIDSSQSGDSNFSLSRKRCVIKNTKTYIPNIYTSSAHDFYYKTAKRTVLLVSKASFTYTYHHFISLVTVSTSYCTKSPLKP